MKHYMLKAVKGKLLKISIDIGKNKDIGKDKTKNKIKKIRIYGDFFFYPEESLHELEKALAGKRQEELLDEIKSFVRENKITILGFTPEDLGGLIKTAFKEADTIGASGHRC